MRQFIASASLVGFAFATTSVIAQEGSLQEPFRIESEGAPITVDVGHAAPFVHDFDGDGIRDLLVGQFGEGKLRIYRNVGTNASPEYRGFEYFKTGADYGTVPAS